MATRKTTAKSESSSKKTSNKGQNTKRQEFYLERIEAKTFAQEQFMESFMRGLNVVGVGSAGTGKSFLSLWLALNEVFSGRKRQVIIIRTAVATRDQGFLKGSLEEKEAAYELPYIDIVNSLCGRDDAYGLMKQKGIIKFMTTSYIRGVTLDNAVIVADEIQNYTVHEVVSILGRVGENTQVALIGDTRQCDMNARKEESCYDWLMRLVAKMSEDFDTVNFLPQDIVRSGFCKRFIMALESM